MSRYLKSLFSLVGIALFGLVLFKAFNFAWDYASKDPRDRLTIEVCPPQSEEELMSYFLDAADLLYQASEVYNNSSVSNAEAAQRFNYLYIQAEALSYPECASLHNEAISLSFKYEAHARSALAEGGWFNRLRAAYYHMVSTDYMYLVPFITNQILPILIPNDGQLHA